MAKSSIRASAQSQSVSTLNAAKHAQTTAQAINLKRGKAHAPTLPNAETIAHNQRVKLGITMLCFNQCVAIEYSEKRGTISLFFNLSGGSRSMMDANGFAVIPTDFLRGAEAFLAGVLYSAVSRMNLPSADADRDLPDLNEHGYGVELMTYGAFASVELILDACRLADMNWYESHLHQVIDELNDVLSDAAVFVENRIAYLAKSQHNAQEVAL